MKKLILAILCGLFTFSACKMKRTHLEVLEPAAISIPAHFKNVGLLNRSLASDKTKIVNAAEQILSGEGKDLDKEGSIAGLEGLKAELMKNTRFKAVLGLDKVDLRTTGSGVFPSPMSWDEVDEICRKFGLDAVFSLELFDTESKITYRTSIKQVPVGKGTIPVTVHHARLQTTIKTGWRIYDRTNRTIVDEYKTNKYLVDSSKGANPVEAVAALVGRKDAVKRTAYQIGEDYGKNILPYWSHVYREYYTKGSGNLKMAARKAQTGNWEEASKLWLKDSKHPNSKVAGRATYNMAIYHEVSGNLEYALTWAQKAYENYNNKKALQYTHIIKERQRRKALLKEQEASTQN